MRALPLLLALGLLVPAAGLGLASLPAPAAAGLACDPACNVRVSPAGVDLSRPSFAFDPRLPGHLVAVANDYRLGADGACTQRNVWPSIHDSYDGGRTWGGSLVPGHRQDGLTPAKAALAPFDCSSNPSVAIDGRGRVLVAAKGFTEDHQVNLGTLQNAIWAQQRVGPAWASPSLVTAGATFYATHEQPSAAFDPRDGVAYVGWSMAGVPIWSRSLTGAAWEPGQPPLWSEPGSLVHMPPVHFGTGVTLAIGKWNEIVPPQFDLSHDLFITFFDGLDIWEGLSIDHGGGWEHIVRVARVDPGLDAMHGLENVPAQAVWYPEPNPARIQSWYGSWSDARFGDLDIVAVNSPDDGHQFRPIVRVNDDASGSAQYGVALATGPDGAVHAAWYDDRNVPTTGLTDVYYSVSRDEGQTWSPNLRVTTQGFDPYLSQDHLGRWDLGQVAIAVDPQGVAHVMWTDTRDGHAAVYAARVLP